MTLWKSHSSRLHRNTKSEYQNLTVTQSSGVEEPGREAKTVATESPLQSLGIQASKVLWSSSSCEKLKGKNCYSETEPWKRNVKLTNLFFHGYFANPFHHTSALSGERPLALDCSRSVSLTGRRSTSDPSRQLTLRYPACWSVGKLPKEVFHYCAEFFYLCKNEWHWIIT